MIKKAIKGILGKSSLGNKMIKFHQLIRGTSIFRPSGLKKKYPKVIQLPITTRCNAKCVMCNIPNMDYSNELTLPEFQKVISDPIFKEVISVGINGGEPSLVSDLVERALVVIHTLPKLKSLNIISNGFLTNRLLEFLEGIYKACKENGIFFHVSISLDGLENMHNEVRGVPRCFTKTMKTISAIQESGKFCDSYDVGCTVVEQNVDHLIELDTFAQSKGINIKYRLGISNKRIESDTKYKEFNLFDRKPKLQSAKEFFYSRFRVARNIHEKFKYYAIFRFLLDGKKRMLGCNWQDEGITLDPKGNVYYCAVESELLGNIKEKSGEQIFFDEKNLHYRRTIIQNKCDECIHDYSGKPSTMHMVQFLFMLLKEQTKFSPKNWRI